MKAFRDYKLQIKTVAREKAAGCSLLLLLLAAASGICLSQEPIRVRSTLVHVAFSARDANGAPITKLTADDVKIFESGTPQKISYFARSEDLPLTLGLILDESGSQEHEAKQHEHDLEVFLKDVLGPKDRAFLVCFDARVRLVSDFSQSGDELMDRLKEFQGKSDSKKAKGKNAEPSAPDLGPPQFREGGTSFYDSVYYSVFEKMEQEGGRRALIVFSDGEDNASSHDMMTTIEEAQTADVLVFTIRYTEDHKGNLSARNEYGMRVMDRLAKETGGEEFDAKKTNPHEYFKQIGDELRTSYELGYYPTNSAKDDTFRTIAVKTNDPGIKLRLKTGYYAR